MFAKLFSPVKQNLSTAAVALYSAAILAASFTSCIQAMAYDFSNVDGEPLEQLWQAHMKENPEIGQAALSWMRGTSPEADPQIAEFKINEYLQLYPDPDQASGPDNSPRTEPYAPTGLPLALRPTLKTRMRLLKDGYTLRSTWHAYLLKYFDAASRRRDTTKNEFKDRLLSLCGEEAVEKALSGITTNNISTLINSSQSIVRETDNILILLDNSNSMGSPRHGASNGMQEARALLKPILAAIPDSLNCGLRIYGGACDDHPFEPNFQNSKLVVPPITRHSKDQILRIAQSLSPSGESPLLFALREAISKDLSQLPGKSIILLIGDGQETYGAAHRGGYDKFFKSFQFPLPPILVLKLGKDYQSGERTITMQALANITKGKYYDIDCLSDLLNDLKSIGKKPRAGI